MKTFLKSILNGSVLACAVYVILGVILIFFPELTMTMLVRVGAGFVIALGIGSLLRYIFKGMSGVLNHYMTVGLVMIIFGATLMARPALVIDLVPVILGIVLLIEGLVKLQRAVDLARMKYDGWVFVLLLAAVSIVFSALVLANPFGTARTLVIIIGVGLLFGGITGIVVFLIVTGRLKKMGKLSEVVEAAEKSKTIEGEAVETVAETVETVEEPVETEAEDKAVPEDEQAETAEADDTALYVPSYKRNDE